MTEQNINLERSRTKIFMSFMSLSGFSPTEESLIGWASKKVFQDHPEKWYDALTNRGGELGGLFAFMVETLYAGSEGKSLVSFPLFFEKLKENTFFDLIVDLDPEQANIFTGRLAIGQYLSAPILDDILHSWIGDAVAQASAKNLFHLFISTSINGNLGLSSVLDWALERKIISEQDLFEQETLPATFWTSLENAIKSKTQDPEAIPPYIFRLYEKSLADAPNILTLKTAGFFHEIDLGLARHCCQQSRDEILLSIKPAELSKHPKKM